MLTEWGERVTPMTAWQEYPRPQLRRAEWKNLNGLWDYAITDQQAAPPLEWEISTLKTAGFNMIRKHIKVEPRRYYYHCDQLGMLVWQDHLGWKTRRSREK